MRRGWGSARFLVGRWQVAACRVSGLQCLLLPGGPASPREPVSRSTAAGGDSALGSAGGLTSARLTPEHPTAPGPGSELTGFGALLSQGSSRCAPAGGLERDPGPPFSQLTITRVVSGRGHACGQRSDPLRCAGWEPCTSGSLLWEDGQQGGGGVVCPASGTVLGT